MGKGSKTRPYELNHKSKSELQFSAETKEEITKSIYANTLDTCAHTYTYIYIHMHTYYVSTHAYKQAY